MTFILTDSTNGLIDAVITTKTTSQYKIEKIINDAMQQENSQWLYLREHLPKDCEMICAYKVIYW